jgi:protein TonB
VIVLAGHFALIAGYWLVPHDEPEGAPDAPAVLIDLAPIPVSPASQQDLAPGPEMTEAQPTPTPPQQTEPEIVQPVPKMEVPAEVTLPEPEPKAAEKKPEEKPDTPESETKPVEENSPPAPRTTAAPRSQQNTAVAPAAPTPGSAASRAAIANWRDLVMARLQQAKRYPHDAQSRHEQGVAMLAFSVDRNGHVLSRNIVKGSGFAALDEEALALVMRVQPLPAFPPVMSQTVVHLTVPIRFKVQ